MAEEKKPEGKKSRAADEGPFTTLRVYEVDGGELSDLANLDGRTVAQVYEKYLRPVVRKALREKFQERLKKMGS